MRPIGVKNASECSFLAGVNNHMIPKDFAKMTIILRREFATDLQSAQPKRERNTLIVRQPFREGSYDLKHRLSLGEKG